MPCTCKISSSVLKNSREFIHNCKAPSPMCRPGSCNHFMDTNEYRGSHSYFKSWCNQSGNVSWLALLEYSPLQAFSYVAKYKFISCAEALPALIKSLSPTYSINCLLSDDFLLSSLIFRESFILLYQDVHEAKMADGSSIESNVGTYLARRLIQVGIKEYFAVPGDYNLLLLDQ